MSSVVSATVAGCLRRDCVEKLKDLTQTTAARKEKTGGGARVTSAGGTVHCNGGAGLEHPPASAGGRD